LNELLGGTAVNGKLPADTHILAVLEATVSYNSASTLQRGKMAFA
jgi:hypothetical protein